MWRGSTKQGRATLAPDRVSRRLSALVTTFISPPGRNAALDLHLTVKKSLRLRGPSSRRKSGEFASPSMPVKPSSPGLSTSVPIPSKAGNRGCGDRTKPPSSCSPSPSNTPEPCFPRECRGSLLAVSRPRHARFYGASRLQLRYARG